MNCKDCIHDEVCEKHNRLVQIDEHTWDECMNLDDVENFCKYFKHKADFVEVKRCSECKFNVANMQKDELDETDHSGKDIVCSRFMTDGMLPTDFCSYGAKMDGGKEE